MRHSLKIVLLLLGFGAMAAPQHPATAILPGLMPSIVRVDARSCGTTNRIATGFVWRDSGTAVTTLHAVAGCASVGVYYEVQKLAREASVVRVYNAGDLALLQIRDPVPARALAVDPQPPTLNDDLATLGYQLQIPSMMSTSLHLRIGGTELHDIVPPSVADQISRAGSPSLTLNIMNIEGHLVHGLSGAPILNQKGNVVAIADGGLENGAVGISWAVPSKYLNSLASSADSVRSFLPNAGVSSLFAADMAVTNKGESMCGALPLTKLQTVSFSRIAASVDDPLGLQQLVTFFNQDPSGFSFDVYQHLPSGATVVFPAGARLTALNGQCQASIDGAGKILMRVEVSPMSSEAEAQARSSEYEKSMAGSNPEAWVADPQFTYLTARPRFDGLVVRRKGFEHGVIVGGQIHQDRYLFETLAVRGSVFLGSSVMNTYDFADFERSAAPCRVNAFAPGCGEIIAVIRGWAQAVLSVHLSTFPIG